ncbi:putative membrane protein [Leptospira inadai serovar Lyme str. 10]|uniref:Histidine kinase N-terminal 7TM region domain-containing protein n=2 Tax=Leptospira inadai serovar Lyme TaxID=293084 RepID=A0ABX4YEN1_9LEPT|nr:membrane protein [Leptospira inadai]EQA37791.1 putative membrane protein [Leptospira inadai serovar Lyme str. 10]PNV73329.1 hypothetical protein BES34_017730 [Leptospira inadai serovar Lyme]
MSIVASNHVVALNLCAALFFVVLGALILVPKPRKAVQILFGIMTSFMGLWFSSFILREIVPYSWLNALLNLGLAASIPAPFLIYLISISYNAKVYRPNWKWLIPHLILVSFFLEESLRLNVLTLASGPGEQLRFTRTFVYSGILLHSLVLFLIAIFNFGRNAIHYRGKTRVSSVLLLLGLLPPIVSVAWYIWIKPTHYGIFTGGQAAIGSIFGIFIWTVAIVNCNAFKLRTFSMHEPDLPHFVRMTKPIYGFFYRLTDPMDYEVQDLARKRRLTMNLIAHDYRLGEAMDLPYRQRVDILVKIFGKHLK